MKEPLASRRTALYRFYDAGGTLLYAGITHDLQKRWNTHRLSKTWWHLVHRTTHEWYDNRALAEAAERGVVDHERPRFDASHYNRFALQDADRYEDPRKAEIEARLRVDIDTEEFRQGRSLPLATALAARYDTSPMTVSQLFWKLEGEGVIEGRGSRWWLRGCRPARKAVPGTVE